jgi:hypothetical protein
VTDGTVALVADAPCKRGARTGVAVVITTYNHAHFLGEALESALRQSHPPDEVIVVDDGSADDPASVVSRFRGVRLISQRNKGLAAARNTGWRSASSGFVVFLDADDRLLPEALASNLWFFEQQPTCGFVYGGYRWISVQGHVLSIAPPQAIGTDAYAAFLRGNQIGMHATVMYRRDVLVKAGGFDERLPACEDYDMYLRLASSHCVGWNPACLAEYRRHKGNMSSHLPLMLHSALRVLRRQHPNASCRADWATAYCQGLRNWRNIYINAQIQDWRSIDGKSRFSILVSTIRVFGLAPQTFLRICLRAVWRRMRARLPKRAG